MSTLQKWFRIGGSHNTNHMTIFLDHVTNFWKCHVIRIEPPPVQIPNSLFITLVILIVWFTFYDSPTVKEHNTLSASSWLLIFIELTFPWYDFMCKLRILFCVHDQLISQQANHPFVTLLKGKSWRANHSRWIIFQVPASIQSSEMDYKLHSSQTKHSKPWIKLSNQGQKILGHLWQPPVLSDATFSLFLVYINLVKAGQAVTFDQAFFNRWDSEGKRGANGQWHIFFLL